MQDMHKPRVFIIEPLRREIDTTDAKRHGEITYIWNRDDHRPALFDTDRYGAEAVRKLHLASFDPDVDFICLVGGTLPIVWVLSAVQERWGRAQVLAFSSTDQVYVQRKIGGHFVDDVR